MNVVGAALLQPVQFDERVAVVRSRNDVVEHDERAPVLVVHGYADAVQDVAWACHTDAV